MAIQDNIPTQLPIFSIEMCSTESCYFMVASDKQETEWKMPYLFVYNMKPYFWIGKLKNQVFAYNKAPLTNL